MLGAGVLFQLRYNWVAVVLKLLAISRRSKGTLQVRFCAKLKSCLEKPRNTKKRQRSGKPSARNLDAQVHQLCVKGAQLLRALLCSATTENWVTEEIPVVVVFPTLNHYLN